ncbi:MAG: transporter substrate-binding domain-containing protein, partial [Gammaproteobacteria bacterium]|nr:transporter substrate-binding domain-containing protein [Gammaproteobacteria bacterium]
YTGIDIDMARSLASHLDAEVEWIHTSWPDLLQDLKSNRFDIAMSGISVRKERAEFGHFSIPYHRGGKTPIARCEDKDKYSSLEKINLPGVRVIVNPGGTNYAFASQNISSASLRIHEDNRTIFDEIAEGRADVMITDAIEVTLKTGRDNRLCPTMPGKTLTSLAKAYLAPKDDRFIYKVNIWLKRQIDQGHFKSALEEHMQKEFIRK